MDVTSVCSPLLARTGSQNNTTSSPNAASVTDADKVIKTQIDSTQVEEGRSEDELKGLLTDDYCHLCEAVLQFESQRRSHYEGKRHAQKLKVYLQTKRAEKTNKESRGQQRTVTTDKDRFCELCNMVFSSQVVAKSHYEGIVHSRNLRKQGLQPSVTERNIEVNTPEKAAQKSALEGGIEPHVDPAANTAMDLKDPNKYCGLCAASFNNPQVALQHYSGRKHQRKQAKQDLIKELGDDVQQASSLMCQMCSVHFNSVETYQAHMHGNKHHIREKKVAGLCKSQQKVYSTFADELADYVQVQKARGIAPKAGLVSLQGDTQKADVEDEKEKHKAIYGGDVPEPHFPPKPRYQSQPGCNYSGEGWHSQYRGPSWASQHLVANFPTPVLPVSGSPRFPGRNIRKRRHRNQSSSSSHSSSSSYSSSNSMSYSSSTSDSDESESKRRDRRRIRSSRKERCRRDRDEEQRKIKHRKERENDSEERRRQESGESDQEGMRKKLKNHNKLRQKEKKKQEENVELERGQKVMESFEPEVMMDSNKRAKEHIQTQMYVEQETDGQDDSAKSKNRKEKKKLKEKVDTRTEEEKLWDDSILGC